MQMRVSLSALVVASLLGVLSAWAGEAPPTVEVVVVLAGGQQVEGMLIEGSKDGTLKIKNPHGENTFTRSQWIEVRAKQRPKEFGIAEHRLANKQFDSAAKKYQEIYETYAPLYIFGAEALDGKACALMSLDKYDDALAVYGQLFRQYAGADLSYARRYRYAVCLGKVGGEKNLDRAVEQLEAIVALTDDVLTVRALDQLGRIHYGNKKYYLALRSFLQLYILYRGYGGEGAEEVRGLVASARGNAIACCEKLMKSSDASIKRRVETIKARLERAGD